MPRSAISACFREPQRFGPPGIVARGFNSGLPMASRRAPLVRVKAVRPHIGPACPTCGPSCHGVPDCPPRRRKLARRPKGPKVGSLNGYLLPRPPVPTGYQTADLTESSEPPYKLLSKQCPGRAAQPRRHRRVPITQPMRATRQSRRGQVSKSFERGSCAQSRGNDVEHPSERPPLRTQDQRQANPGHLAGTGYARARGAGAHQQRCGSQGAAGSGRERAALKRLLRSGAGGSRRNHRTRPGNEGRASSEGKGPRLCRARRTHSP